MTESLLLTKKYPTQHQTGTVANSLPVAKPMARISHSLVWLSEELPNGSNGLELATRTNIDCWVATQPNIQLNATPKFYTKQHTHQIAPATGLATTTEPTNSNTSSFITNASFSSLCLQLQGSICSNDDEPTNSNTSSFVTNASFSSLCLQLQGSICSNDDDTVSRAQECSLSSLRLYLQGSTCLHNDTYEIKVTSNVVYLLTAAMTLNPLQLTSQMLISPLQYLPFVPASKSYLPRELLPPVPHLFTREHLQPLLVLVCEVHLPSIPMSMARECDAILVPK